MGSPSKLECFALTSISSQVEYNTLAYWAHSQATKKMKCCEYGPRCQHYKMFLFIFYFLWCIKSGKF